MRPSLADNALAIWRAGVAAVEPARCLPEHVMVDGQYLLAGDHEFDLKAIERIFVVGAGKASAGMAGALEKVLGKRLLQAKRVGGSISIPAGSEVVTSHITLHITRPVAANEPTPQVEVATRATLAAVRQLGPRDLCIVLLSGGGSALWAAPRTGITLTDKIAVTRLLSAAGADIGQLNTVRRALSDVKGGGLARECSAGQMLALVISDVAGDDLATIASGPAVVSPTSDRDALDVLAELGLLANPQLANVVRVLQASSHAPKPPTRDVPHVVIANSAVAVDGAGIEAERRGFNHAMIVATRPEGPAEDVGRHLAAMALRMRDEPGPNCLITGGEPTVQLPPPTERGLGGRNQQLALAALAALGTSDRIALVAGGTDGEDGPTDAAGAIIDQHIASAAKRKGLSSAEALTRCDAYTYFAACGGLLQTGPTGTNVGDLRVLVVDQKR